MLIRHGESEINVHVPPVIGGRSGWCELTPEGIAQSRALGRWLRDNVDPPERIVSSSAVRAQQTARYALAEAGVALRRIEPAVELEELSQGEWENRPRSEVLTPETVARIEEANWHFRPPGGESMADACARALGWIERAVLPRPERRVWVFCHGVVIRGLLAELFDLDRRTAWQIQIDNTAMTRVTYGGGRWALLGQNEAPHLAR